MIVLLRAVTYASLFIGVLLVFLPARVLELSGVTRPATIGPSQDVGGVLVLLGGSLALWCILTFVFVGRGTPAPFDPPRRLVTRGPYRVVRNPMYLGAGLTLLGAALFYGSPTGRRSSWVTPCCSCSSLISSSCGTKSPHRAARLAPPTRRTAGSCRGGCPPGVTPVRSPRGPREPSPGVGVRPRRLAGARGAGRPAPPLLCCYT